MKRKLCITVLLAVLLAVGSEPASAKELVIGTIGLTGDTYQMAIAWSNLILKKGGDLKLTPVEGGGTNKMMRSIAAGRMDIGFIGAPHYRDAVDKTGGFKEEPDDMVAKYKTMQTLFAIQTGGAQYVTRMDSNIKTMTDFKGKKVAIGAPGGNMGRVSTMLFKLYGLDAEKGDIKAQYLEYGAALEALGNNQLDVVAVWGGVPQSGVYNASRANKLRFVSPDAAKLPGFQKALTNGDYYVFREVSPADIKAAYGDAVAGDAPMRLWTFPMMVIVNKGMPKDTAYALVKEFWEQIAEVKASSNTLSLLDPKVALENVSAEVHPGAARYFQEKGLLKAK
ncbi:MAG: TAXI family TRAP transporter solute-binding subunit [Deltaproteobacteria bacterium]|nr:TAXI family TRAP transporter solute-binding subunit [Deltaproteobacteria bacterium]